MRRLTTARFSPLFTICRSAGSAIPEWANITASGDSAPIRTPVVFYITALVSISACATHRTIATRCCVESQAYCDFKCRDTAGGGSRLLNGSPEGSCRQGITVLESESVASPEPLAFGPLRTGAQ